MVWVSTTTRTPRRPRRKLRQPLQRNMRFSLRWLPSIESLGRILHLPAKKYMSSIQKCDHSSLGHYNIGWDLAIGVAFLGPPVDSLCICHAYAHISAKFFHYSIQT